MTKRFAGLDQWRGFAMVLVLINHGLKHTGWVEGLGRSGVNLFFVISGLLTALSIKSLVNKKENYFLKLPLKRLWRLYPVLIIYFIILWALGSISGNPIDDEVSLLYPFYCNYLPSRGFGVHHIWSITCELHFYFLSPILFWLGTTLGRSGKFLMGALLLGLTCCMGLNFLVSKGLFPILEPHFINKYTTHVAVWPMLLGFCFVLYPMSILSSFGKHLEVFQWKLIIFSVVALFGVLLIKQSGATVLVGLLLIPGLLVTYINKLSLNGWAGQGLDWIGKRTYSIYLIQQTLTLDLPLDDSWKPFGALLAIPAGGVFYWALESRFLGTPKFIR
ncbi:acyltransferase family protein [Haloferula chungangensis]|uniref:Acyltransferase family protein n=1 Tax=Haloferula chungangensis TaxID=1048331 RepID=A0ABW2LA61_9BACT